jgi:hypothetical protein
MSYFFQKTLYDTRFIRIWWEEMEILGVTLFGYYIPLWLVFLIVIIAVLLIWKLIKFALKILLIIVVFFVILFGLDLLGFFDAIQGVIGGFL